MQPSILFRPFSRVSALALLLAMFATLAGAASYPVSGKWTYDNASAQGPAKDCGARYMEFQGEQRFDKGGGVPGYRNYSVTRENASTYQVTDQFATGQISARSTYTLRLLGPDHIELHMNAGGKTIKLRRCQ